MAIFQQYPQSQSSSFLLDALYCQETEHWLDDDDDDYDDDDEEQEREFVERESYDTSQNVLKFPPSLVLLDQDLVWEDEELVSLFSREEELKIDPSFFIARKEAVDWILKVKAHFGFSALTAILAINYLDRFFSSFHFQKDKPWMIQLVSVTCLSLAAKIEETQVPLLIDLQVKGTKYLFEAKNIQKMELLVMSALKWRMNPVTPISFLDHLIRRLGLKSHLHLEFFKTCEALTLSFVSDSRFAQYLPSVLATATMLHAIDQIETSNSIDYQNQLLDVLKATTLQEEKVKVKECYELIVQVSVTKTDGSWLKNNANGLLKRKFVVDTCSKSLNDIDLSSDEYSNESSSSPSSSSSSSSADYQNNHKDQLLVLTKRKRVAVEDEEALSNLSRAFVVDVIGSSH